MKKILLFGGSGLVGYGIKQLLSDRYHIKAPTHSEVDVTKRDQVIRMIEKSSPDNIIYAVGLASIDRAERDPELANLLNAKAPAFIAKDAASFNIPFLYFSTNAVFDGTEKNRPYRETDNPNPNSIYGKSKLLGEKLVLASSSKNCIARIIMPYSPISGKRKNFAVLALEALQRGELFYGITDQIINPIYIRDLAKAIDMILKTNCSGLYHLGAKDYVTNLDFIKKLARRFNVDEKLVKGISFEKFFKDKKTSRTKFCWLDISKFQKKIDRNILQSVEGSIKVFQIDFESQNI